MLGASPARDSTRPEISPIYRETPTLLSRVRISTPCLLPSKLLPVHKPPMPTQPDQCHNYSRNEHHE